MEPLKLRHYEKATKFEKNFKNLPPVLTKQLFLLSSVKSSGSFFQFFVAFSEKLDFIRLKKFSFNIYVSFYFSCKRWLKSLYLTSLIICFLFTFFRVVSTILSTLQIEGFDVKALRAFRVLRPLRLVSGVPSKLYFRIQILIVHNVIYFNRY